MAFPTGFPARSSSGIKSLRFYQAGTANTAVFSDNAFLFISGAGANPYTPLPVVKSGPATVDASGNASLPATIVPSMAGTGRADVNPQDGSLPPVSLIWSMGIRVCNDGTGVLEISFDGTNTHGSLKSGEIANYARRHEAGISLRCPAGSAAYRVESW